MSSQNTSGSDFLIRAGKLIRSKREDQQKSRKYLAQRTRISVAVIQALENGWEGQLPEGAYLTTMLRSLEEELGLEDFVLVNLLSPAKTSTSKKEKFSGKINANEFLSKYRSIFLYLLCMSLSIFLINRYQLKISIDNAHTISPIKYNNTIHKNNNDVLK